VALLEDAAPLLELESDARFAALVADVGDPVRRHSPYAFTEHGGLMAATVLNSPRAIAMSV